MKKYRFSNYHHFIDTKTGKKIPVPLNRINKLLTAKYNDVIAFISLKPSYVLTASRRYRPMILVRILLARILRATKIDNLLEDQRNNSRPPGPFRPKMPSTNHIAP